MSVSATLHIHSGLPDRTWQLAPTEIRRLINLVNLADKPETNRYRLSQLSFLGDLNYSGFSFFAVGEKLPRRLSLKQGMLDFFGNAQAADLGKDGREFEDKLLKSEKSGEKAGEFRSFLEGQIQKEFQLPKLKKGNATNQKIAEEDEFQFINAPIFGSNTEYCEEDLVRLRNNCYNYACDKNTNTFARPGRGSGCHLDVDTIEEFKQAVISDKLTLLPNGPPSDYDLEGHVTALFHSSRNTKTFHWYHRDKTGFWSHKMGMAPPSDKDNSGNPISDPSQCDKGRFDILVGYFQCIPHVIKIN